MKEGWINAFLDRSFVKVRQLPPIHGVFHEQDNCSRQISVQHTYQHTLSSIEVHCYRGLLGNTKI